MNRVRHRSGLRVLAIALAVLFLSAFVSAQKAPSPIKRTTFRTETVEFAPGGSVSVMGAPIGSVSITGSPSNKVVIEATIQFTADSPAALDKLSEVTGFATEVSAGRIIIRSLGTSDKAYVKRASNDFPRTLLARPTRIDYTISVPAATDLQIDGGSGDLAIADVFGAIRISFLETNARIEPLGGALAATIGSGSVVLTVPDKTLPGASFDVAMASGTLDVLMSRSLNAELDAAILRSGKIRSHISGITPLDAEDHILKAKLGSGGTDLRFTLGAGTLTFAIAPPRGSRP